MNYNFFQIILSWVYQVLENLLPKKKGKDILPVNLGLIITPRMKWALTEWGLMYINLAPWTTKEDGITPNGNKSLNIPAAVASELARTTTIEMTVSVTGSERADFLNSVMQKVLHDIRRYTEYACAKGGLIFKPYITSDYSIGIDYVQADMFYPISFNSDSKLIAICPVDMKQVGGKYYKRFEYHTLEAEGEHVWNWAFKSEARDDMGEQCSLQEIPEWADIAPEALFEEAKQPLYGYFRMPFSNNIDPLSPIGVSVYARAVDLIEQTDQLWNEFNWEFESGHRALYVDNLAFGKDPRTGKPVMPKERLYRTLNLGTMDDDFFKDWTPTFREVSFINALETHYRMIEFQCGISEGVLPRPAALQIATATEVKMTQQRTYSTITDTQKALRTALEDLLYAVDYLATAYDLAPAGAYNVEFGFDDSIVHDHDAEFSQDIQEVGLGTMSRQTFIMRNHDVTEEEAKKELALAQAEAPVGSFFSQNEPVNSNAGF